MKTILIAEDHEIVRHGIRMMIDTFAEKYRFIETATCAGVVSSLQEQPVHCMVLDMSLADGNILSILDTISAFSKRTHILVYSMNAARVYAWRFLQKGVKGFVEKQASMEELEKAIREVLQGEMYLSQELKNSLFDHTLNGRSDNPFDSLSDRELEVAEHLTAGLGAKEIAYKMSIDITTVSTYRRRAFAKMKVQNVMELKEKFLLYT